MKSNNINTATLKKYVGAHSANDLNHFLENLPQNAGKTVLIAAAVAWGIAAAGGLFATIQAQKLTQIRAEFKEMEAAKPTVPQISNVAIPSAEIQTFVEKAQKTYRGISLKANNANILITATSTSNFAEFREAIGHVQNGGNGWRVTLEKLCVGRECDKRNKLMATLRVNKVSVENPAL